MADDLYERDFYAWTQVQASALRQGRAGDNALDFENLAEEVGDLGRSQRRACESYIDRILQHLLKIQFVGPRDTVPHWRAEIVAFRTDLEDELTPSLRAALPAEIDHRYASAVRKLSARLLAEARDVALPQSNPYSWEDVLGRGQDWTPGPSYD